MTIAKFKEALETTGYQVFFSHDVNASYNDNSLIVKISEDNEIAGWLKADLHLSCMETIDFINRLKLIPNLSRVGSIKTNVSYFDDRFSWSQGVLWMYDNNEREVAYTKVDNITLVVT